METALLNLIHVQKVLASKAARVVLAADGRSWRNSGCAEVTASMPRLKAARCAYLAGSTPPAMCWRGYVRIPVSGTMAHSYVAAFADGSSPFARSAHVSRQRDPLLIPTTRSRGARKGGRGSGRDGGPGPAARRGAPGERRPAPAEPRGPPDPRPGGVPNSAVRSAADSTSTTSSGLGWRADRCLRHRHAVNVSSDARRWIRRKARPVRRAIRAQAERGKGDLGRRKAVYRLHDEDILALADTPGATAASSCSSWSCGMRLLRPHPCVG